MNTFAKLKVEFDRSTDGATDGDLQDISLYTWLFSAEETDIFCAALVPLMRHTTTTPVYQIEIPCEQQPIVTKI